MNSSTSAALRAGARKLAGLQLDRRIRIMEVCGTHTTEYFRSGIRDRFPDGLELIDGPGCPVCVTPTDYLDRAIAIARKYGVVITTFGDLMKVPASTGSLLAERGRGLDIRVVYSPADALEIARTTPGREIMFLSVGFETTVPLEAAAVEEARETGLSNFSLLTGNKLTPPAVRALLESGETPIDGFILPGHVCTIIGLDPWQFIGRRFQKPSVVAGFSRRHILSSTLRLVSLIRERSTDVVNDYPEAVSPAGNPRAWKLVQRVFWRIGDRWRGIGRIPDSGLALRPAWKTFDARLRYPVTPAPARDHPDCRCGEVLTGRMQPPDCPLFGGACTPDRPVGACMVSTEGACAAYHKYRR